MLSVTIYDAKNRLSELVKKASAGEPFIITEAGKPLVKVLPCDLPEKPNRLGCMVGHGTVARDLDIKSIVCDEISDRRLYT